MNKNDFLFKYNIKRKLLLLLFIILIIFLSLYYLILEIKVNNLTKDIQNINNNKSIEVVNECKNSRYILDNKKNIDMILENKNYFKKYIEILEVSKIFKTSGICIESLNANDKNINIDLSVCNLDSISLIQNYFQSINNLYCNMDKICEKDGKYVVSINLKTGDDID